MLDLAAIIDELAIARPVFHSEADFQHALAMQLAREHPHADIRLEYRPISGRPVYTDIWITLGDTNYAIELKYKTRGVFTEVSGERFELANHGAQDIGKHDFWKDVQRIEEVTDHRPGTVGAVVFLTNDSSYWRDSGRRGTCAEAFGMHNGRQASGHLAWAEHTGAGTKKNREAGVSLTGCYLAEWRDYGSRVTTSGLTFRYTVVRVGF